MGCWTWQAMSGTGAGTGMMQTIMQTRQIIILQDLIVDGTGYFAAGRGTSLILRSCAHPSAAAAYRPSGSTSSGFGVSVRFLNNTFGFLHFYTLGF
jgi:hypothetical protein